MLRCENDECPFLRANDTKFRARCCMEVCPYCGEDMIKGD